MCGRMNLQRCNNAWSLEAAERPNSALGICEPQFFLIDLEVVNPLATEPPANDE